MVQDQPKKKVKPVLRLREVKTYLTDAEVTRVIRRSIENPEGLPLEGDEGFSTYMRAVALSAARARLDARSKHGGRHGRRGR